MDVDVHWILHGIGWIADFAPLIEQAYQGPEDKHTKKYGGQQKPTPLVPTATENLRALEIHG